MERRYSLPFEEQRDQLQDYSIGIEIDPFLSLALRRGVSPMQPGHGVAVENLDADATELNGSRTAKNLLQQFLPGLWL